MRRFVIQLLVTIFFNSFLSAQQNYPLANKSDQTDDYHGVKIYDPYRWLEDDTSKETKEWVTAENRITSGYLSKIPFRDKIRKRIEELYNYPKYTVPFRNGKYIYFYRNDGLQNQSVLYRQVGLTGSPETVLDPNKLSPDGTTQLVSFTLSKDGKYAAWGISKGGSDWQTFYVRDMSTMKDLGDSLNWVKASNICWQQHGFYYSAYPAPEKGRELVSQNNNHQLWYHRAGTPQSVDKLVFEDTTHPMRFNMAYGSEDERYLFLHIRDGEFPGNALFYSDNKGVDKKFKPVVTEIGDPFYEVIEVTGGKFLMSTNDHAPNVKIVLINPGDTSKKNWKTIIPEGKEPIENSEVVGNDLLVTYLKDVVSHVYVFNVTGKFKREIVLPGPGSASGFKGDKGDDYVFYLFRSFNFPSAIYRYDLIAGKSILFRRPEVLFNPLDYETKQVFYPGKDGVQIPMFIVSKKGLPTDGTNPAILYGYGGFNYSLTPSFNPIFIPWLEQGGVYAFANLRGGQEYGERWHEEGMRFKKQNVFNDFIAAAEYLIEKKYTSRERLAIRGESNGGLLIGAVMNQRPDLFKVAIPQVGVMDMLRFHKFTIGWNWVAEYGSSDKEDEFRNIYKYSPLHNLKEGIAYPATLITTADHDDRVVPAHSFKYAATLQEKYKGPNPVLIRIDGNSGHGSSNISKAIDLAADIYAFIFYNMGLDWKDLSTHDR